ncbi:hypothetical protein HGG71_02680 [Rhodobacteraceae bacterium R_SAG2]|nr:hypothetical protein [Rhodobacteraceae bacterium R_SAG2]
MAREALDRIATYSIACDRSGCAACYVVTTPSMTRTFGRQCAKLDGWRITRGKPTLCPDHAPTKPKPK